MSVVSVSYKAWHLKQDINSSDSLERFQSIFSLPHLIQKVLKIQITQSSLAILAVFS